MLTFEMSADQAVEALDTIPTYNKPREFWFRLAGRFEALEMFEEARDAMLKAADTATSADLCDVMLGKAREFASRAATKA